LKKDPTAEADDDEEITFKAHFFVPDLWIEKASVYERMGLTELDLTLESSKMFVLEYSY
jgi:hypothetical protein